MKIVPYRVIFEADTESAVGKYTLSRPTEEMLPVALSSDGSCYEVHTHDRGDGTIPSRFYYQIAFRIEDPSPYRLEDLSLSLDSHMYRDASVLNENNLICQESTKNTPNNLWYQPSRYIRDKGTWRIVADNKRNALPVDCITASGVFRIVVLANGAVVSEEPWVYILPSSISKDDYIGMLNDLVNLHEKLITNQASSVGVGKQSTFDYEKEKLRIEADILNQLVYYIHPIMHLQSEQLGKRYVQTNIQKLKRFDTHVVKGYIKNGCSGKILGIEYFEDHNTYENRIIKYVLSQIVKKYAVRKRYLESGKSLDMQVEEAFEHNILNRGSVVKDSDVTKNVANIKADIRSVLEQETAVRSLRAEVYAAVDQIEELLETQWFASISAADSLTSIEPTPKFVSNFYYSTIYDLIIRLLFEHPLINFDCNSFGVLSTQAVYEYWVFYKMLYQLQDLGFSVDNLESLTEHFSIFIDNLSNRGKVNNYSVHATRIIDGQPFEIEFGNERRFPAEGVPFLTPDFYLKTVHKKKRIADRNYWYFFDAKYRSFSAADTIKDNYNQMIYDVSVLNYISKLSEIFQNNPQEFGTENRIGGSFLIMANCDDGDLPLPQNGRLFGGEQSIFSKGISLSQKLSDGSTIDNANGVPAHRYGAIQLSPSNDSELALLYQMIFEFLDTETHGLGPNLSACWRCNSETLNKVEKETRGKSKKYYSTCPKCHEFRVETRCVYCRHLIVKHAIRNYHQPDPMVAGRWSVLCPSCARSLNRR